MTQSARYVAHTDTGQCHLLEAKSFEDAALNFAEAHAATALDDELRVIVQSEDGERERCFVVRLNAMAGARV